MFIPLGYPLSSYTPPNPHALPPPPIILADRFDAATGDIASLFAGDDPTDAAIQWQCTVRQGSGAALGANGHRFHLITKATEGAPLQLADEGRRLAAKYVERGDVRELVVQGDVLGSSTATGAVEIAYVNVHTEQAGRVRGGL